MPIVELGNSSVIESARDAKDNMTQEARKDLGQRVTTVTIADDATTAVAVKEVLDLWQYHSNKPPAWVESDDEELQEALASEFNVKAGRPASFKEGKKR